MQQLIAETFEAGGIPSTWQLGRTPRHSFERGGLRSGTVSEFLIPLPGTGWRALRVELDIVPLGSAVIECGDGVTAAVVSLKTTGYPRHEIRKYRRLLAESTRAAPDRDGVRKVVLEFDHGQTHVTMDGEVILFACDPFPRPFMGWLKLTFWEDVLLRKLVAIGDDPCPAVDLPARRSGDFFLEVNVDFFDDLRRAPFTRKMFDDLFAEFAAWGVRRCHWIYRGEKADGWWDFAPMGVAENAAKTFENVGCMFSTAVQAAHAHGLEIYGLIKPFDTGFQYSFGEGTPEARAKGRVRRIGGPVGWIDRFPAEHPEYLFSRKPGAYGDARNEVFTRIDLVKEDDRTCAFAVGDLALHVSDDNATYRPYEGAIRRTETIEEYPLYEHTASGGRRTGKTRRCRVMRLEGLNIRNPYFALSVPARVASFTNTLIDLIHVFGEQGEERLITLGCMARNMHDTAKYNDFREIGMEFDHYPGTPTAVFAGFDAIAEPLCFDAGAGVLAVARGKDRTGLGLLSPAFGESRDLWIEWVRSVLEYGADGVELRVRNHHYHLAWGEYGFEAPVVDEFKKRHGVDLLSTDDFDRAALRRLRGEFYTQFYRDARQLVDAYGKRLGLHVSVTMDMEPEQGAAMETHWDWKTWLQDGLADSVTMKEVRPGTWLAQEILALTRPRGVSAIYCPFNSKWSGPDNVRLVQDRIRNAQAGGYDGFQFYECAAVVRGTQDGKIVMEQPALADLFRREFVK